jgi:hypothetical protein
VDANVPAGLVVFMRTRLHWDVLFVVEHDDLRRSSDGEHYRLARQFGRTLITFDRDYLDDRRFPPGESGGVVVLTAPDESGSMALLKRLDERIFRASKVGAADGTGPLEGRKMHVHVDWTGSGIDVP